MTIQNLVEQDKHEEIIKKIQDVKFGEINIIIHEGKIVQINRVDKKRYTV